MTQNRNGMKEINTKGKRTGIDFSQHELKVTETDLVTIHELKKPNTIVHSVKFINVEGSLVVKGDFGNWMFCRSFIPCATDSGVSDDYWCEKLHIYSTQSAYEFDRDKTEAFINELIAENEGNENLIEYLDELKAHLDDGEGYYMAYAWDNLPDKWDNESIPNCKSVKPWLRYVFDAFDHCCYLLSQKN